MPPTEPRRLAGDDPAATLRDEALERLAACREAGVDPCLATLLVSDAEGATAFMDRKHDRCAEVGIDTRRIDLPADAPAERVYRAVEDLAADPDVTALFVQVPLPTHVDEGAVRERVPPEKDVDCFAPANVGRFVAGDPRVSPVTTLAVDQLLSAHGVEVAGQDAVVVGRTPTIGSPLAHLLCRRDATVTVCHSKTRELGAKTRTADLLVTAAGAPGLVDGSMVSEGVVVVDVSATRVERDGETAVVGDVDAASVGAKAAAMTPVPGGVGPMTMAALLYNVATVSLPSSAATG
ncbi:bifunctional 5,10-methylenetetrahydrofolate dehydrogenase/5,10-methenyltetrahydrofolate cyclohydrolase [Haloplanus aerogenes]|uniref:Bifunctional protein FolD n=1 Tax=Haloplanus aerogenes TaxID=660522 RepID=A0A3M0DUH0_9EURY|nr:tetrahydrofolate dehydrogenase/cyclohydrolase catalytic domain-containing protein [Haloplanus aerogenes]AZH25860.1 bifunctional 5,10-methylene-tetrahydrofolate dehydrogenase/5,10-methylene-tetrahydrofolate cyclohydrolase [Haloplanus aerogenes]RMB25609.1 methylenetetrahydrofolate dehydrogenase (NADP+)/methenyltetrahydrofolate cyclohydrolase [Haloplanus aerogenes]